MPLERITKVSGRAVPVPGDDLDTDRIIPARFLKCVTFDDLGEHLFEDARAADAQAGRVHPLDEPRYAGATVLISGSNFGCGSSREHAPQSIYRHGIRAIVAQSFAEIFFGNCTTIGLPCVEVDAGAAAELNRLVQADPATEVTVDVAGGTVSAGGFSAPARIPESARKAFLSGTWDQIGELLDARDLVAARARALPYLA